MWQSVEVVAETGSTNADLIARATAGDDIAGAVLHRRAPDRRPGQAGAQLVGGAVRADHDVGGDRRRGVPTDAWGWLPLATGVAIVDTVTEPRRRRRLEVAQRRARPVAASWRAFSPRSPPSSAAVVVGIGLNVSLSADEVGVDGVTSLVGLGVTAPDRERVIVGLLGELGVASTRGVAPVVPTRN